MKFLKSENKTVFTLNDATSIAMEMINIFYGIQYFDDGKQLVTPRPGYMRVERGNCVYDIVPAFGRIYLSEEAGSNFDKKRTVKALIVEIRDAFVRLNIWGLRPIAFSTTGNGQFAVAVHRSTTAITITDKVGPKTPYDAQMTWHVMITTKLWNNMHYALHTQATDVVAEYSMSAATIFMDYALAAVPFPRSISWPAPPAPVTSLAMPLHITLQLGVEAHVYYAFTKKLIPDADFNPVTTPVELGGEHKHTHCYECSTPLWGDFYVNTATPYCKFCIHYGGLHATAPLARCTSAYTIETVVNSMKIDEAERKAVLHMLKTPPVGMTYETPTYAHTHGGWTLYSEPYVSMHGLYDPARMSNIYFEPIIHLITKPTVYYRLI